MKNKVVILLGLMFVVFSCKKPNSNGYCDVELENDLSSAIFSVSGLPFPWLGNQDSTYSNYGIYLTFTALKKVNKYDEPPCDELNDTLPGAVEYINVIDHSYVNNDTINDTINNILQILIYYYDKYYTDYYNSNQYENPNIKTISFQELNNNPVLCSNLYCFTYKSVPLHLDCYHSYTIVYKEKDRELLIGNTNSVYMKQ